MADRDDALLYKWCNVIKTDPPADAPEVHFEWNNGIYLAGVYVADVNNLHWSMAISLRLIVALSNYPKKGLDGLKKHSMHHSKICDTFSCSTF